MFLCRRLSQSFVSKFVPSLSFSPPYRARFNGTSTLSITIPDLGAGLANADTAPWKDKPRVSHSQTQGAMNHVASQISKAYPDEKLNCLRVRLYSAYAREQHDAINTVITDLISLYRRDSANRFSILHEILERDDLNLLQPIILVSLLQLLLSSPFEVNQLSPKSIHNVLRLNSSTLPKDGDDCLSKIILAVLLEHLRGHCVPPGLPSLRYRPSPVVKHSFEYLRSLIVKSHEEALDLYNVLINTGHIPPEAIPDERAFEHGDLDLILYSSLVRACLHWGWAKIASRFLQSLLKSNGRSHESVPDLIHDTLFSILEDHIDGSPEPSIPASLHLIIKAHPLKPVPDGLVRRFYEATLRYDLGSEAESLYSFTKRPEILATHHYPPPRGSALGWLMQYLSRSSPRTYLCRQLAQDVIEENIPIPVQHRARFISITANTGNASLARALWQRYALGKEMHIVVGDPGLLISMTRLFSAIVRQMEAKMYSVSADNHVDDDSSTKANTSIRHFSANAPSSDPGYLRQIDPDFRHRLSDISAFQERLIEDYKDCHNPLANASHRILTSYARACFIGGEFKEGFNAFKILYARKEVPDIYDINVALSAIGEWDPRRAANVLDHIIKSGIRPDATTFGTVMDHALVHTDFQLVDCMADNIKRLERGSLSLKSMTALIRAVTTPRPTESRDEQLVRLREALMIVQTWMSSNSLSSPQAGKHLVIASLRVEDPLLAFNFWKVMLKDSVEWEDHEQKALRTSISRMIQRDYHQGLLTSAQSRPMLSRLAIK